MLDRRWPRTNLVMPLRASGMSGELSHAFVQRKLAPYEQPSFWSLTTEEKFCSGFSEVAMASEDCLPGNKSVQWPEGRPPISERLAAQALSEGRPVLFIAEANIPKPPKPPEKNDKFSIYGKQRNFFDSGDFTSFEDAWRPSPLASVLPKADSILPSLVASIYEFNEQLVKFMGGFEPQFLTMPVPVGSLLQDTHGIDQNQWTRLAWAYQSPWPSRRKPGDGGLVIVETVRSMSLNATCQALHLGPMLCTAFAELVDRQANDGESRAVLDILSPLVNEKADLFYIQKKRLLSDSAGVKAGDAYASLRELINAGGGGGSGRKGAISSIPITDAVKVGSVAITEAAKTQWKKKLADMVLQRVPIKPLIDEAVAAKWFFPDIEGTFDT